MKRAVLFTGLLAVLVVALLWAGRATVDDRKSRVIATVFVKLGSGHDVDVFQPPEGPGGATVVLLHGCCGDRTDMKQMAVGLAERGVTAMALDWGGLTAGGFPARYQELACSLEDLADLDLSDLPTEPPFILAWSDGALPGATIALADQGSQFICPAAHGVFDVAGFIGVAGFYGWPDQASFDRDRGETVDAFFAGDADVVWAAANPYTYLDDKPLLPMLLIQSADDPLLEHERQFAAAAIEAGHDVSVVDLLGVDHQLALAPRGVAGRAMMDHIVEFVRKP